MRTRPSRRRTTLRARIIRTTATNVLAAAVGVGSWSAAGAWSAGHAEPGTLPQQRPVVHLDRVRHLMATHGCWSGEAPAAAPEPRHALVTLPGGRSRVVPASVGYGIWLEGEPGVLHAFCR